MEKHKWHRIKALRHMLNESKESVLFPALAYGNTGLGVSREIVKVKDAWKQGDDWRVIHIPLGICISTRNASFKKLIEAKLCVKALASIVDWHTVTLENAHKLGIKEEVKFRAELVRTHGKLWYVELTTHKLLGGFSNAS